MQKQLEEMNIRKAENGGHTVRHEFKRQTVKREGSMNGGMYSERPPSEEHVFGPEDDAKLMAHVKSNLGMKAAAAPAKADEESD